jgi:hypothetical protein
MPPYPPIHPVPHVPPFIMVPLWANEEPAVNKVAAAIEMPESCFMKFS